MRSKIKTLGELGIKKSMMEAKISDLKVLIQIIAKSTEEE